MFQCSCEVKKWAIEMLICVHAAARDIQTTMVLGRVILFFSMTRQLTEIELFFGFNGTQQDCIFGKHVQQRGNILITGDTNENLGF